MDSPAAQDTLHTHARFVRALAQALLRDPHEADDLAQEVWLAWLRRPANSVVSVRGWLARATRNLAKNRRRAEARRAQHEAHGASEEPARAPDEEVEEKEVLHRLIDAVYALEEPYRGTLLARYFRGLDARALAAERGFPLATVRSQERRALEQLRQRLERTHGNRAWAAVLLRFVGPRQAVPASLALAGGIMLVSGVAVLGWRGATGAGPEGRIDAVSSAAGARLEEPDQAEARPAQAMREALVAEGPTQLPELAAAKAREPADSGLGSLSVRVREEDGRPVVGVTVKVEVTPEDRVHGQPLENEAETGVEGEVLFPEVVAGVRLVVVVDPDPSEVNDERRSGAVCGDRLALAYECMQPLVLRAGIRRTLEVVLPPLHTVHGRVIDPEGAPLPYAKVDASSRIDGSERLAQLGSSIRTDSDGTFELSFRAHDATQDLFLCAGAPGPLHALGQSPQGTPSLVSTFEWSARKLLLAEELAGVRAVELRLASSRDTVLVAEVVEPDGSPSALPQGQVEFSRADGAPRAPGSIYVSCPPSGLLGIGFAPGEYRIESARAHGTPEQALFRRTDPIPADGETHIATQQDEPEVVVRLRGEALAEVLVTRLFLAPGDEPARGKGNRIEAQAPWLEHSATLHTPELHGLSLTVGRTVRGSDARIVLGPPGRYRLGVRRHGYMPLASEILTLDPGEHEFTLAAPLPHAWIEGRLRADPGQAFHALELYDETGHALTLPSRETLPDPLRYLGLPASGTFMLDPLAPGRYLLRLGPMEELLQGRATLEVPLELQPGENPPLDLTY